MLPFRTSDLAELLNAVDVGLWHMEVGAPHVWWCPRTCAIHNMPVGSRPSLDVAIGFYAAASRTIIESAVQRGIEDGEAWDLELEIITAKNIHRWVRAQGRVVRDAGRPHQLLGTIKDITEHRAQAAELSRFATVIQQMTNAAIMTDPHGLTTWVNPSFESMTGYTLEQMIGRSPGSVLQGPDTDRNTIATMRTAVRAGAPFHVEVLNYRADRRPYWIDVAGTP